MYLNHCVVSKHLQAASEGLSFKKKIFSVASTLCKSKTLTIFYSYLWWGRGQLSSYHKQQGKQYFLLANSIKNMEVKDHFQQKKTGITYTL